MEVLEHIEACEMKMRAVEQALRALSEVSVDYSDLLGMLARTLEDADADLMDASVIIGRM